MGEKIQENENVEIPKIGSFETERGSVYSYDTEGRVTRLKKTTGETFAKSDVVAFIPPWDWIQRNASNEILEKLQNELILKQEMLRYIHAEGSERKIYLIDEQGNKIDTRKQLEEAQQPFIYFGTNEKADFTIPVSKIPKIDYTPYDSAKYKEGENDMRYRHIGHKITKINYL